jgi:competence protein ComEC
LRRYLAFRLTPIAASQQGRLTLWLPVFMIAGVLAYFALRFEPPPWLGTAALVPLAAVSFRTGFWVRVATLPAAAAALGFASAQLATFRALPLEPLPRGAVVITAIVGGVDLLPQGRRITLSHVQLNDDAPLPRALRVRLRNNDPAVITQGDTIRLRALVEAPPPPAYPGAWDLQRDAFYSGLGGYGFALGKAEVLAHHARDGPDVSLQSLREVIARRFQAALPGAPGAVAATLLTGTPTAIPEQDREAFRASGLAHLLAVAGLHIGIVMGLILGATRTALARWEYAALHWPTKQIAAVVALAAGGFYMTLTGTHVPILRSFAMATLFTLAVLLGRPAISLRGLALAAAALVLAEPQEVPGVSFQMSFAAVLALIAGYEILRPHLHALHGDGSFPRRFALHLTALALTSLLAGTASAPYGAYHFGRIQLYFVPANMIAVPLTALWVMPAGLMALALMPVGLERLALIPMGWGINAILFVARETAALPDATMAVPHIPSWGMALVAIGMALLGLWRGAFRVTGVALIAAGLATPLVTHPPDLLVAADAHLVGFRTREGIFLEKTSSASAFTRDAWTQYWASGPPVPMPAEGNAASGVIDCQITSCLLRITPAAAPLLLLRQHARRTDCGAAMLVIALSGWPLHCAPATRIISRRRLHRDGATAIWLTRSGPEFLTDSEARGNRPWIPPNDSARPPSPLLSSTPAS